MSGGDAQIGIFFYFPPVSTYSEYNKYISKEIHSETGKDNFVCKEVWEMISH